MKKTWCIIAVLLMGCTAATPAPTQTPWIITATPARSATATPTIYFGADTISWNDARNFIGQTKTVCGNVVRTTYAENTTGQPTYLDVGRAYPDSTRLSVVIWGNQRANFPTPPETMYRNKTICVQGTIKTYQGVAQIEVRTPAQIEIK
ncbi:MAG: hypothetical protein N2559_11385 [Anaerolineae bacterium]|nr:hypothetical protein [Anaerolineae bacterium]